MHVTKFVVIKKFKICQKNSNVMKKIYKQTKKFVHRQKNLNTFM